MHGKKGNDLISNHLLFLVFILIYLQQKTYLKKITNNFIEFKVLFVGRFLIILNILTWSNILISRTLLYLMFTMNDK